jgi:uncharacterized coiled-coil protein SlyX
VLHLLENRISRIELEKLETTVGTRATALAKMRKDIDALTTRVGKIDSKGKPGKAKAKDNDGEG